MTEIERRNSDLFQEDRRKTPRENPTDRRTRLRPTRRLRWLGLAAAGVLMCLIYGIYQALSI